MEGMLLRRVRPHRMLAEKQVDLRMLRSQLLVRRRLMRRQWCLRMHRMLVTRQLKLRRRVGLRMWMQRRLLRQLRARRCWLLVDLLRKQRKLQLMRQRLLVRQLTKLLKRLGRRLVLQCCWLAVVRRRHWLLRWQLCRSKEGLLKHRHLLRGRQWLRVVGHRRRLALLLRRLRRLVVRVRLMRRRLLVWRLVLRGRVLEALQPMWRGLRVMLRGRLAHRVTRRLLCRVRRLVHW